MKKNPPQKTAEPLAAYDTGIYRDLLRAPLSADNLKAFEARTKKEDAELFDLKRLLARAAELAQKTIDLYEDRPPTYEEWRRRFRAWEKNKTQTNFQRWRKLLPPRLGYPRAPSKTNDIPDNANRQLCYAQQLRAYVQHVQQALRHGDASEAALYGFWVGRFYEALRVCSVEHVAMTGRKVRRAERAGHAAVHGTREEKQTRWAAYQNALDTLASKHPHWSLSALRAEVARQHGVSFKTIERHTVAPRKA
ncbi:MAG: hypothetical protein AB1671_13115 [Thermodesulfobacteriota bacterium]|jgi:hypothetical protein